MDRACVFFYRRSVFKDQIAVDVLSAQVSGFSRCSFCSVLTKDNFAGRAEFFSAHYRGLPAGDLCSIHTTKRCCQIYFS